LLTIHGRPELAKGNAELRLEQSNEAVAIGALDSHLTHQLLSRARQNLPTDPSNPSRGRRAMGAIELTELINGEPVEHVLSEKVLFTARKCGYRVSHRLFELTAVALLDVFQLGI